MEGDVLVVAVGGGSVRVVQELKGVVGSKVELNFAKNKLRLLAIAIIISYSIAIPSVRSVVPFSLK